MKDAQFEKVVRELAKEASLSGQKFLVMKNYQELPYANRGKDIDLIDICTCQLQSIRSFIIAVYSRTGQYECFYFFHRFILFPGYISTFFPRLKPLVEVEVPVIDYLRCVTAP